MKVRKYQRGGRLTAKESETKDSRPEFSRFLSITKASCGEVRSMAYLTGARKYLSKEDAAELIGSSKQLSRSIKALSNSLK